MTEKKPNDRPLRVGLISLGCAKNLVDAEIMLGALLKDGVEITNDPAQADAVIVNTCSFIDSAQEESVDTILESAEVRAAKNRGQSLIVSGCLPQRFRDELPKTNVGKILRRALRDELRRMVDAACQGKASECRVIEVLSDHSLCSAVSH